MRILLLLSVLLALHQPAQAQSSPQVVFILDASGSMWGQVEGEAKITIARTVLRQLIEALPDASQVGLIAYGHRRKGDCTDVETLVPLGPLNKAALIQTMDGLNPKGKTPITVSAKAAIELAKNSDAPVSIILISDGLETCNADPCDAVGVAKASGIPFVMHVVGFDVGDGDTSQLECTARAGEGLYLGADRADELLAALRQAVEAPVDPDGVLSIGAQRGGAPHDAVVKVFPLDSDDAIVTERTYTGPETNPRVLYVPDGKYRVTVTPLGLDGVAPIQFTDVLVAAPEVTERVADFSTGELAVSVLRNGELFDAVLKVVPVGGSTPAANGRSYTRPGTNPWVTTVPPGEYDIEAKPLAVHGVESLYLKGIVVTAGQRTDQAVDFITGTLRVGATAGGALVDAMVKIRQDGKQVAGGRTYGSESSNPKGFDVSPGTYEVTVSPIRLKGVEAQSFTMTVEAASTITQMAKF